MAQVVVIECLNEDIFICGLCKAVFNTLSLFLEHKKMCIKGPDSLWPGPSNALEADTDLLQASDNVIPVITSDNGIKSGFQTAPVPCSSDKTLSCSVCSKSYKQMKSLNAHMKSHKKPSQCPLCGRCFISNSHLKRHITSHKVWPSGLNETTPKSSDVDCTSYSCPYCPSVLGNYGQFRAHLNSHISLKKFKCVQGECNSFFDTIKDIVNHTSLSHDLTKFTCHMCKTIFNSLEDIALHYQNHGECYIDEAQKEIPQYKCKHCDAVFRKPEKLSLHMLTENHKKTCIQCNKTFASDKRLRMHLQTHRQSKPFKCNVCGETFHMKKYLTAHLTKHGSSQFPCDLCKQTFKRQDILQRHKKSHMPRNQLKCLFRDVAGCDKVFTRKDKLKEHMKSHRKFLQPSSETVVSNSRQAGTMEICIVPLVPNSG